MHHDVTVNEQQSAARITVRDNGPDNILLHFRWALEQPEPELWVWGFASRDDFHAFAEMIATADRELRNGVTT